VVNKSYNQPTAHRIKVVSYSFSRASSVMRPTSENGVGVWTVRERADFNPGSRSLRAPEHEPSAATVSPKPLLFEASFDSSPKGKGTHLCL
jgi:hypothetical protein